MRLATALALLILVACSSGKAGPQPSETTSASETPTAVEAPTATDSSAGALSEAATDVVEALDALIAAHDDVDDVEQPSIVELTALTKACTAATTDIGDARDAIRQAASEDERAEWEGPLDDVMDVVIDECPSDDYIQLAHLVGDRNSFAEFAADQVGVEFDRASVPASPPPLVEDPGAEYTLKCDYLLGDFSESRSGYRFVAGGRVRNTGNVGLVVRVVARWEQLGSKPLREVRTFRLAVNKSRRVAITRPATSDEIDLHQSANSDCKATAALIDTFGEPVRK